MILNLTQHPATAEQLAAGVVDPKAGTKGRIVAALTFNSLPTQADVAAAAAELGDVAQIWADHFDGLGSNPDPEDKIMIGGAPYLMAALEARLHAHGLTPVYAFSQRESVEEIQADGSVRKVAIFRHSGFVAASPR